MLAAQLGLPVAPFLVAYLGRMFASSHLRSSSLCALLALDYVCVELGQVFGLGLGRVVLGAAKPLVVVAVGTRSWLGVAAGSVEAMATSLKLWTCWRC